MKKIYTSIARLLSLAAISVSPLHAQPAPTKDIVDTAVSAGSFKTLAAALTAAGLVDTLKGKGPFTVFAPTDEAFAKLPPGAIEYLLEPRSKQLLTAVLTNHVVAGEIPLSKALERGEATTLRDSVIKIKIDGETVKIGDSTLASADIKTTNGVIHVIDTVLIPDMPDPALIAKSYRLIDFISLAEDRAEVFTDKGQHEVSATIFEVLYQTLLVNDGICEESRKELTRTLRSARAQDSASRRTSVLRLGLAMPKSRLLSVNTSTQRY